MIPLYKAEFLVIMELPDWHVTRKKIEASNFTIELQVYTCTHNIMIHIFVYIYIYTKQVLTQSMLLCGIDIQISHVFQVY